VPLRYQIHHPQIKRVGLHYTALALLNPPGNAASPFCHAIFCPSAKVGLANQPVSGIASYGRRWHRAASDGIGCQGKVVVPLYIYAGAASFFDRFCAKSLYWMELRKIFAGLQKIDLSLTRDSMTYDVAICSALRSLRNPESMPGWLRGWGFHRDVGDDDLAVPDFGHIDGFLGGSGTGMKNDVNCRR